MRRKVIIRFAAAGALLLLTGAVAVSTVDKLLLEPLMVESSGGLVEKYIKFREQWGPIVPPGVVFGDVAERMSKGDWSFLKENWYFTFSDGVLYVPEKSALAKELKLPIRIQMREDMKTGQIYIFSAPLTDEKEAGFVGVAAFSAPEFMPYEKDFPQDKYLFDELSPRRIVWEITLKPEADAWADLIFQREASASSAKLLEGGGMMSMMMVPEEYANDLWLCLEPQSGSINLNVFAPEGFTNRVEIYSCTDLISNVWTIFEQNLYPSGTNPVTLDVSGSEVRFYAAGNMDIDSDVDGIPDASEKYIYKTDPNNPDTDGDGMPDGWELQYSFNPLVYADGGFDFDSDGLSNANEYLNSTRPDMWDTDGDLMPDGWEVAGALNPLIDDSTGDPDGDGVNNLAEYNAGTHPQIANITPPAGATGGLVFRYDDDGRLKESHLNNASSELYSVSPAHNLTVINIYAGN